MTIDEALQARIEAAIQQAPIVVFMKGNKSFPQCGFSATVVEIMKRVGVEFATVNILADQELREGLKVYSDWPTFPQVYIRGELIGGCDIVRDMYESGELTRLATAAPE